jgi:hypothetical protein
MTNHRHDDISLTVLGVSDNEGHKCIGGNGLSAEVEPVNQGNPHAQF